MKGGGLLDTNIISELRRPRPDPGFARWWDNTPATDMYLSVITLGEITQGIARLRPRAPDRAAELTIWVAGIREVFADRVIDIGQDISLAWGELRAERTRPAVDMLIAATAQVHRLHLVTRNARDFADLGVKVIDPFSG